MPQETHQWEFNKSQFCHGPECFGVGDRYACSGQGLSQQWVPNKEVCGVTKGLFIEVRAGVKNRHGILLELFNWPDSLASSKQLSQRRAESDGSD